MENVEDLIREIGESIIPTTQKVKDRRTRAVIEFDLAMERGEIKSHGQRPAHYSIIKEQPEHTLMLWMKAAGKSDKEVVESTGINYQHFKILQRQPWWIKRFNEIVESCNKGAVEQFIHGEVIPSLMTLKAIRDDETQRGATRVAAANSILDRGLGKATVRVETKNITNTDDTTQEIEQLRQKAADLSKQLAAGGAYVPGRS